MRLFITLTALVMSLRPLPLLPYIRSIFNIINNILWFIEYQPSIRTKFFFYKFWLGYLSFFMRTCEKSNGKCHNFTHFSILNQKYVVDVFHLSPGMAEWSSAQWVILVFILTFNTLHYRQWYVEWEKGNRVKNGSHLVCISRIRYFAILQIFYCYISFLKLDFLSFSKMFFFIV